jgi:ribosomal protein S18 acetylase RimI-like enzyme
MEQIETIAATERDHVLARVLAPAGRSRRASQDQVRTFVTYISSCELDWRGWRCSRDGRETALLLVLLVPGNTAIAMFPAPEEYGIRADDQQRLIDAGLERLADRRLHYVQALVEPDATGKRNLLEASGFRHLTQLIYLQRAARYPVFDPPGSEEASWIRYSRHLHANFAKMIRATYEDSQDCPELADLRPVEAVIASHKAAGEFNPALWEIALIDGEHAGCVLLAPLGHGSLLELVYMGVVPGWRRRGVGRLLLRRALAHCDALGIDRLTAAVDARNHTARQLYSRFGFRPMAAREAYINASSIDRRWRKQP